MFFCLFCGVGLFFSRFSCFKIRSDNFFLNFFTGFAFIGLYFSLVQLFIPLTLWTLLPVLILGGAGIALSFWELKEKIASAPFLGALSLFFLFLVSYSISNKSEINAYDDFLYHASIVSWLNAYKAVPGIANLHFRLGMNSLYLQVAAGLDVAIWDKRSSSITVCLMYFSFLMYCVRGIYTACTEPSDKRIRFAVCQAVFILWLFFTEALEPYLNYDNPALVFAALIISEMLLYSLKDDEDVKLSTTPWETLFLFSAVSFAIKPMGAVAVFLVFLAALAYMAKNGGITVYRLFRLSILPLCVLVLFIVRNVIQTGYLMFPMTLFKIDLPWTVSKQIVDINMNAIQNYSRTIALGYDYVPGQGFWYWFIPWLKLVLPEGNNILLPFVLCAGLVLALFSLRGKSAAGIPLKLAYYGFAIINLLFCFISVPELRYDTVWIYGLLATALFFSPGICSFFASVVRRLVCFFQMFGNRLSALAKNKVGVFVLAVLFLLASLLLLLPSVRGGLIAFGSALARHELNAPHWEGEFKRWGRVFLALSVSSLCYAVFVLLAPKKIGCVKPAYAVMLVFAICSCAFRKQNFLLPAAMYSFPVEKRLVSEEQDFYVYVAVEGDQCGDAPLPCTPEYCFSDRLRLLDPSDMGKGFYILK